MKTQIVLVIFSLFVCLRHAAAQVSFTSATNYATPYVYSIAAADVNGDGKVDLVCAQSQGPGKLLILTNNGSGLFGTNAMLAVGNGPQSVTAADLRGTGWPDLISANKTANTLSIWTNNGSGTYGSNATLKTELYPIAVVAADLNRDGHQDLVCAMENPTYGLMVYTNNGKGEFGSNAVYSSGNYYLNLLPIDLNRDGNIDLIANSDQVCDVWTNNGAGIFGLSASISVSGGLTCFTVGDVNGDGKPDLIIANGNAKTQISVWTNNGAGILISNTTFTAGYGVLSIAAADVNGDGLNDLVCGDTGIEPQALMIFTNNGNGGFGSNLTVNIGYGPLSILTADLNGDGKVDLACANQGNSPISVTFNTSLFPPPTSTPALSIVPGIAGATVSWPLDSAGWSLQQKQDLTTTNWSSAGYNGYPIENYGMTNSLIAIPQSQTLFFRLFHP